MENIFDKTIVARIFCYLRYKPNSEIELGFSLYPIPSILFQATSQANVIHVTPQLQSDMNDPGWRGGGGGSTRNFYDLG